MPRAYISARVKDELRIKQLRDRLWMMTDARRFYKKKNPHITVVPPFTVKEGCEREVERLVDDCPLKGREVEVNTLGVYENIHKPYVVLLDVDVEIEEVRNNLIDDLQQYVDGRIIEPVRPHITLFKTQGWWDEAEQDVKETLQYEIMNRHGFKNTEVSRVVAEFKS